jgi:hypothetical protein
MAGFLEYWWPPIYRHRCPSGTDHPIAFEHLAHRDAVDSVRQLAEIRLETKFNVEIARRYRDVSMRSLAFALMSLLAACTSVNVRPIPATAHVDKICIRFNEEVNVEDLVTVVQDNLGSHGIQSVLFRNQAPAGCPFQLTYTADRWWDLGTYLVDANISVWNTDVLLGSARSIQA